MYGKSFILSSRGRNWWKLFWVRQLFRNVLYSSFHTRLVTFPLKFFSFLWKNLTKDFTPTNLWIVKKPVRPKNLLSAGQELKFDVERSHAPQRLGPQKFGLEFLHCYYIFGVALMGGVLNNILSVEQLIRSTLAVCMSTVQYSTLTQEYCIVP